MDWYVTNLLNTGRSIEMLPVLNCLHCKTFWHVYSHILVVHNCRYRGHRAELDYILWIAGANCHGWWLSQRIVLTEAKLYIMQTTWPKKVGKKPPPWRPNLTVALLNICIFYTALTKVHFYTPIRRFSQFHVYIWQPTIPKICLVKNPTVGNCASCIFHHWSKLSVDCGVTCMCHKQPNSCLSTYSNGSKFPTKKEKHTKIKLQNIDNGLGWG